MTKQGIGARVDPVTAKIMKQLFIFILVTLTWCVSEVAGTQFQADSLTVDNPHLDFFKVKKSPSDPFAQSNDTVGEVLTVATKLKGFSIPFQMRQPQTDTSQFIEAQLYLSTDRGRTWQFYGKQSTDENEFPFTAEGDGEYWFSIKVLNRDRQLVPAGDPVPELKVIVDSIQPELELFVETDAAGRVICRWKANDPMLATNKFRMLYQSYDQNGSPENGWTPVNVDLQGKARNGTYGDQIAWWPKTQSDRIRVAVQIADQAGNTSQQIREIKLKKNAWRAKGVARTQIANKATVSNPWVKSDDENANWPSQPIAPPANSARDRERPVNVVCENGICRVVDNSLAKNDAASKTGLPAKTNTPSKSKFHQSSYPNQQKIDPTKSRLAQIGQADFSQPPQPSPLLNRSSGNSIPWESSVASWTPRNQSGFGSTRQGNQRPDPAIAPRPYSGQASDLMAQSSSSTNNDSRPDPIFQTEGDQVIAESSTYKTTGTSNESQGNRLLDAGQPSPREPGQFPGSVASFRKSSAAHSQQPSARDAESVLSDFENDESPMQMISTQRFQLNYGIDSIDPSGVARVDLWATTDNGRNWKLWGRDPDNRSPFPVSVEQEGRYGFRIVVHSRDGLTGQGPSSGDRPDIQVHIDTTAPLTRISSVPYGRGVEAGKLVINYSVADPFLTLRPVNLFYASGPDGPWNVIERGLRNEGRFAWKPTEQVPERIFIRLESLDQAGNVGQHTLSQSIDISGLIPRGTILGVVPVGK